MVLDITGTTRNIEDSRIGTITRKIYVRNCIDFMIVLFDSHPSLLIDLQELKEANAVGLLAPVPVTRSRAQGKSNLFVPFCYHIQYISLLLPFVNLNRRSPSTATTKESKGIVSHTDVKHQSEGS